MDNKGLMIFGAGVSSLISRPGLGILTLLLASYCLIGIPLHAQAASAVESPARIIQTARQYIHQVYDKRYQIKVDIGYLDKRLRLARCEQGLQAFFPVSMQGLIASSVGVRCGMPNWQIYIPVEIQAYAPVLTTSQPLAMGTVLGPDDLVMSKREISQYRSGVFTNKQELIGMVLKRPLAAGDVITPRAVAPKRLVKRGDPVIIMAQTAGMTVRVQGQALMDGRNGDMIQVRNTHSGKKLVAEVIATSTVRVIM